MKNFAVFILTHRRANKVVTYKTLRNCGYKGKVYFIVDNEDKSIVDYMQNFGQENIIVFDKMKISREFDLLDNFDDKNAIVFARNACWDIAEKLGLEYFAQFDDDYTSFEYRYEVGGKLLVQRVKSMDCVFKAFLDFMENTSTMTICMAQGGDMIGGAQNDFVLSKGLKRKAMNSFICSVNRKFTFIGRVNEDVNTYTSLGQVGRLFFTTPLVSLVQSATQQNKGGMSDLYKARGTYIKSFYTIICSPSSVSISLMQSTHTRLHHMVKWNNVTPKIISEKHKKI